MRIATTGIIVVCLTLITSFSTTEEPVASYEWPRLLSEWELFEGAMGDMVPSPDLIPYEVNSPLFSDYAYKARYIKLPKGEVMHYVDDGPFDIPQGSVLVKSFYYPSDFRDAESGLNLMETRIMVLAEGEWHGASYVWNESATDAVLSIAGDTKHVSWRDAKGKKHSLDYLIPNVNQCANCHTRSGRMMPIGISAVQLHRDSFLDDMADNGHLAGVPVYQQRPRLVDYLDDKHSLDARARSYLHSNCGHCHSKYGPANSSGLYLVYDQEDIHRLGVMKSPVAAGRGSGGRLYNIVPGKPQASILLHRMESDDPGVRMPEINRQLEHEEGTRLIREWIKAMD